MPQTPRLIAKATTALLLAFVVGGTTLPAAHAEDVATAQARVDKLQGVVAATTKTLTDGTRQWEQDKAALAAINAKLELVKQHVAAAQKTMDDNTQQLSDMARQLYMSPSPNHLELAVTRGPEDFTDAVQQLGALNVVADTRTEIVRRAAIARAELTAQQDAAAALAATALSLEQRSEKRMRDLQSLARTTAIRLSAAQKALVTAREIEAARIAAAEKAAAEKLARAQQLREQERARAAAAAAAAAAARVIPGCKGVPVEGQQNGFLDPASLCPLWEAPGMSLKGTAAAAFNLMSKYHAQTLGTPLCVTGGYRTYQRQVSLYAEKPGLAAVPGNSEHGWGNAVDLCGGIERAGTPAHQWMQVHAADFGWFHPAWAEPSGSRPEAWHWEFNG